jgi:hypothetical protein
MERLF